MGISIMFSDEFKFKDSCVALTRRSRIRLNATDRQSRLADRQHIACINICRTQYNIVHDENSYKVVKVLHACVGRRNQVQFRFKKTADCIVDCRTIGKHVLITIVQRIANIGCTAELSSLRHKYAFDTDDYTIPGRYTNIDECQLRTVSVPSLPPEFTK